MEAMKKAKEKAKEHLTEEQRAKLAELKRKRELKIQQKALQREQEKLKRKLRQEELKKEREAELAEMLANETPEERAEREKLEAEYEAMKKYYSASPLQLLLRDTEHITTGMGTNRPVEEFDPDKERERKKVKRFIDEIFDEKKRQIRKSTNSKKRLTKKSKSITKKSGHPAPEATAKKQPPLKKRKTGEKKSKKPKSHTPSTKPEPEVESTPEPPTPAPEEPPQKEEPVPWFLEINDDYVKFTETFEQQVPRVFPLKEIGTLALQRYQDGQKLPKAEIITKEITRTIFSESIMNCQNLSDEHLREIGTTIHADFVVNDKISHYDTKDVNWPVTEVSLQYPFSSYKERYVLALSKGDSEYFNPFEEIGRTMEAIAVGFMPEYERNLVINLQNQEDCISFRFTKAFEDDSLSWLVTEIENFNKLVSELNSNGRMLKYCSGADVSDPDFTYDLKIPEKIVDVAQSRDVSMIDASVLHDTPMAEGTCKTVVAAPNSVIVVIKHPKSSTPSADSTTADIRIDQLTIEPKFNSETSNDHEKTSTLSAPVPESETVNKLPSSVLPKSTDGDNEDANGSNSVAANGSSAKDAPASASPTVAA
ncbi:unnamed protein product [Ambrosiozyma monospora]|uniref:Unnamed protein product n=1 Tax=Ambrosiozyma monospora TaxID=43982 RepID=A0ACB5T893_AMBMO|nr:unnamed protein product [Ambrosiozyma monospora]